MKRLGLLILFLCCLPMSIFAENIREEYQYDLYRARVIDLSEKTIYEEGQETVVQEAEIIILNKEKKGEEARITNTLTGDQVYDMPLTEGAHITVHLENDSFYFISYDNTRPLIILLLVFLISLLVIGGLKGLKALIALSATISLIIFVMIPLLLNGFSPIFASVLICALAAVITFFIISGVNKKSFAATIGTIGGLILGGLIAYGFGAFARLSGFSADDATMLLYLPTAIDFDYRGLLFAGIIIGALGAAMDVAISIASALSELQKENPNIPVKNLIASGFNIGRDIMGTMINTLVLAYIGGTITIMLLFVGFETPLFQIINLDFVATEIVRAVAGSIGLLFAIPITIFAYTTLTWHREEK